MTTSAELTAVPAAADSLWPKFALALGLVGLADMLLYEGRPIGLSLPLFLAVLAATGILVNIARSTPGRLAYAALLIVAGLAAVVEEANLLSFPITLLMILSAVALATDASSRGLWLPLSAAGQLLVIGPLRLLPDTIMMLRANVLMRALLIWSVPVALGCLFTALFATANPVIAQWFDVFGSAERAPDLSIGRVVFWFVALSMIWPFIHLRWRQRTTTPGHPLEHEADQSESLLAALLGPATVVRSLILFNILFAIQTALDGVYLWGHAALPSGVTYAAYAHRGAYLLIVTALLAAAFVIVAARSEITATGSPLIRPLIYLWVAQNVVLVVSSIQRLHMYVETYALTYWRIAALIWMILVAVGLILIVLRIALNKPGAWLIRMNLLVLSLTLYGCAFINLDAAIADYNVSHSREAGQSGPSIDSAYLAWLGPQALPAIDRAMRLSPSNQQLLSDRDRLLLLQQSQMAAWRSWSFRGWRLQRHLAKHPPQDPS
ncbi:hypothetical protein SSBR45G_05300 [Bradyrhizobium sp. SSBR45G]|uniref:DUF4153 domain-containing protein n=1 Tax=unclassified Bradyrhizobium TaxID=2631580 RepID=UPI002342B212|nr:MULTISPECIES: DUF4173 domain-containing protein [unclassified Bradyrhizobium]GLH75622.1 hypothetical protein SSBR45G_05300 [Bradyrhizobium sp. SSBR45G]GLH82588.1 hypothetical protein SSBR45R_00480 [Bradyrhizobium sp. SSBR45R]